MIYVLHIVEKYFSKNLFFSIYKSAIFYNFFEDEIFNISIFNLYVALDHAVVISSALEKREKV